MLFHITGPAGSGKTTVGVKLSGLSNTVIIDTDEIDDSNAIEIIENPENSKLFSSEETVNGFWNLLEQKNTERLAVLLEKNKGKNIIIVGMNVYPPGETDVHGYSINFESDNVYAQLNTWALESICSNCSELKNLFIEEKNKYKVDLSMLFKFKLRRGFPLLPIQISQGIELIKKHSVEIGYKYLKQNEIIQDITKLIEQNNITSKSTQSRTKGNLKSKNKSNNKSNKSKNTK